MPNNFTPLSNQIEEKLLEYIKENNLQPGDKLPTEKDMKELFQIGRSSLREAISRLVTRNVLETKQGSGTYVKNQIPPDLDPLGTRFFEDKLELAMDFISVRLLIEPEMAALAAKKATQEQKKEIENLCNKVEEKIRKGENHMEFDIEFHTAIARYSQNKVIENLVPLINSSVATLIDVTNRTLLKETISSHRQIVQTIMDKDELGAKNAMIIHLEYNRRAIVKRIKEK